MTIRKIRKICVGAALSGLMACAGVLGLQHAGPRSFPHRSHVVAGVSCMRCHNGVQDDGPALHLPSDDSCTTCHAKPHDTRPCLGCHVAPNAIAELGEARDHLKFDHRRHLDGVANGNCMRCHTGVADGDSHMRPAMATCFKCHGDGGAQAARKCDGCHKSLGDEGALPQSHLAHDGDWLREHGTRAASSGDVCESCHKASYCAGCHGKTAPALPATRRFTDPFAASVHRAGFLARHSLEARSEPGACNSCHTPDRCVTCHTQRGVAGRASGSPHPFGWVGLTASDNLHGREARRDPASCAGCHGGAGESLCVQCHAVGGVGGNPHPPGWSSRQPLSAMPCRMCHPVGSR
ncbi:MAG TPA: cytochrome c3 family protein [Kofleriaceae bacterium]